MRLPQNLGRFAVRLTHPCRVDAKRRSAAAAVAKAASDRAQVHARSEKLRRRVVPQGVQTSLDADAPAHPAVAMRHGAGIRRPSPQRIIREEIRVIPWLGAHCSHLFFITLPVLGKHGHRRRIQGDPTHLVGLCILLDPLGSGTYEVPPDGNHACVKLDIGPTKRECFCATHPCHHHQPDESAPVRVLSPRSFQNQRSSAALGGSGCGRGCRGLRAFSAGFVRIHSHLTAAAKAALMIQWTCRIVDAAIGRHECGGHSTTVQPAASHSCGSGPGRPGRRL